MDFLYNFQITVLDIVKKEKNINLSTVTKSPNQTPQGKDVTIEDNTQNITTHYLDQLANPYSVSLQDLAPIHSLVLFTFTLFFLFYVLVFNIFVLLAPYVCYHNFS